MIRLKSVHFFAVLIFLALIGAGQAQNKPLKKVRVGVPSVGVANIIIFIAKEGKLYEKHGLDAEVITVNGSGIGSKALISGLFCACPAPMSARKISTAKKCTDLKRIIESPRHKQLERLEPLKRLEPFQIRSSA
ncbi:MAG TPA: hypothetical protein VLM90_14550 [Candidatus Deferrimicrobium sp.]|nr:hypothetical protein [Candidatus Deferrimicrobium sp.]